MVPETKIRILQTALRLYNEHGVYKPHGEQITARRIAAELNMSDGNLRYHFPTKEDIIRCLYDQLTGRLQALFGRMQSDQVNFAAWLQGLTEAYELLYAYRFLLRDFVGIMQHQPELKLHFRLLQTDRIAWFQRIIDLLKEEHMLRAEPVQGQFDRLMTHFQLQFDFWIAQSELMPTGPEEGRSGQYARLTLALLVPYLTVKGLQQWQVAIGSNFPSSLPV